MKNNYRGFSLVEVLIVISVIALVGVIGWVVYDNRGKQPASPQTNAQTEDQKPTPADPYKGWKTYTNAELGYSFMYPSDWSASVVNYGDKLGVIQIDSANIITEEQPIGFIDVIKGSRATLSTIQSGNYAAQTEFEKQYNIKIIPSSVGNYKAIEYSYAMTAYIRLGLNDSQYITTTFTSEGDELGHPNYAIYKKILASIKQ